VPGPCGHLAEEGAQRHRLQLSGVVSTASRLLTLRTPPQGVLPAALLTQLPQTAFFFLTGSHLVDSTRYTQTFTPPPPSRPPHDMQKQ